MKRLFICIIATLTLLLHLFSPSYAQTPTAEPNPTSESVTEALTEQITDLKEKIASRVAELNLVEKRGIVGVIEDVDGTQITIEDTYGDRRFVDVDEITEFDSPDAGATFGISDLENGMQISVLGLYNKQSERVLARFINEVTVAQFITGTISAIDEDEFTISVTTRADTVYTVDVETTTTTQQHINGDFENSGFSQMEAGQTIFVTGTGNGDEANGISASRILLFTKEDSPSQTEEAAE